MGYNGGARDMLCTEQQQLQKQCWWGWVAPVLYYIANAGTRHSTHLTHISITCCTFFDQGFSSRFSHLHGILVLLYIWQLLYLLEEKKMTKTPPPKQNKNIYLVNWKTFLSWNKRRQRKAYLLGVLQDSWMLSVCHCIQEVVCQFVHILFWFGQELWQAAKQPTKWNFTSYFLCSSGVKVWIILLTENNDK